MKSILIFLFLLTSSFVFSQQEVKLCTDAKTVFIYTTQSNQSGNYWWELDGIPYQGSTIKVDWNDYSIGQHFIEVFFVSDSGCNSEPVSIIVDVLECPLPYVWIPNSFTPNSDNDNDTWFPIVKNISFLEVRIFNRWGEEIFFSNDVNSSWNGYYSNQLCQNGVYVYLVNWKTIEGRSYAKTGHIVLIR